VNGVRSSTADAAPPTFTPVTPGFSLFDFLPLTTDDVVAAVCQLPDKHSASDPVPTNLLKDNVHLLAPFLVTLFNRRLSLGSVPSSFKGAYVTPLLNIPSNCQLIGLVKVARVPRCSATSQLPEHGKVAS